MKQHLTFLLTISLMLPLFSSVPVFAADPETIYVEVNSTKLREKPQFWAKGIKDLKYGDRLTSDSAENAWYHATDSSGGTGYIHATAVTKKKVVLSSKAGPAGARPDETDVVLAGKGFNREIEQSFAANDKDLNYNAVNAMERIKIGDQQMYAFLQAGKLNLN